MWRRWQAASFDLVRDVQHLGLGQLGRLAAGRLGEQLPVSDLLPWQMRTLEALLEVICEGDGDDLPEPIACGALEVSLTFIRTLPLATRERFSALLAVVEYAPVVLGPVRKRFTHLTHVEQVSFLSTWPDSKVPQQRVAFQALKSLCMMAYWSRPQTWSAIGYSLSGNPGVPKHLQTPEVG